MRKLIRFLVDRILAPIGASSGFYFATQLAFLPITLPLTIVLGKPWIMLAVIGGSGSLTFGLLIICCYLNQL
jgi:hypothetical protein